MGCMKAAVSVAVLAGGPVARCQRGGRDRPNFPLCRPLLSYDYYRSTTVSVDTMIIVAMVQQCWLVRISYVSYSPTPLLRYIGIPKDVSVVRYSWIRKHAVIG